jgi:hypothetical protein
MWWELQPKGCFQILGSRKSSQREGGSGSRLDRPCEVRQVRQKESKVPANPPHSITLGPTCRKKDLASSRAAQWRSDIEFPSWNEPERAYFLLWLSLLPDEGWKSPCWCQTFWTVLKLPSGVVFTALGTVYITLATAISSGCKNVKVQCVKQVASISLKSSSSFSFM